jgi:hypothetical protein
MYPSLYEDTFNGISAAVIWPAPRTFEVTVDFDSKVPERALKAAVATNSFLEVEAKLDEARISLPVELPPGKHRLVIRSRCP